MITMTVHAARRIHLELGERTRFRSGNVQAGKLGGFTNVLTSDLSTSEQS